MTTLFLRVGLAACALSLAACSILPKADPVAVYRLPAAATTIAADSSLPNRLRALRVITPYANRTIDSERILVLPEGDVIQSYGGVRWSDPAPVLVRDRLLEAFNADGRFAQLSSDNANIAADLELNGSLVAFQTEYRNGVPTVVIQFDARLIDSGTRQQVAARRFAIAQPAAGAQVAEVVNAFGVAANALSGQVVSWAANLPASRAGASR